MAQLNRLRRTAVDEIFDHLEEEITSMRLRPGDRISEVDIAERFGVSRQPVRDAFNRLATLDLLLIRPQRATEVRRFSAREIEKSRFVRAAVEAKVLEHAAQHCNSADAEKLERALSDQKAAIKAKDVEKFGKLDYAFHEMLCKIAKADFAFDVIMTEKSKVDRLCKLSLSSEDRMPELVLDHAEIANAVKNHDGPRAVEVGMKHLSRLDETIARISDTNANYFEPE